MRLLGARESSRLLFGLKPVAKREGWCWYEARGNCFGHVHHLPLLAVKAFVVKKKEHVQQHCEGRLGRRFVIFFFLGSSGLYY